MAQISSNTSSSIQGISRRGVALGVAASIHALIIWMLAQGLVSKFHHDHPAQDVQAAIIAAAPSQKSDLPLPELPPQPAIATEISPPDFAIEQTPLPTTVMLVPTSAPVSRVVPPYPDPIHRNTDPRAPSSLGDLASRAKVVLSVLVRPDGRIGGARVAKSSGNVMLDDLAAKFATTHWRFRPAILDGRAVEDWTTVLVAFGSS